MAQSEALGLSGLAVEFTCGGQTTQEEGRLLGVAAMVVKTNRRDPLQAEVELRFRSQPNSPLITARGVVTAHVEGEGEQIQFTDLPEEHRRHLLALLYPPGADRRATKRVSLATQIRTSVDGETLVGYTRDISTGGVFVETENPSAKGTEVKLRFKLTPDSPIQEVRAVVAYSINGEGMGLRFVDLKAELREAIAAFVTLRQ
ncbi:MAG: PilZ domain-containing protein [Terriglobia bacterium]